MKTGRNDPCPCGSDRKFKKCCGLTAPVVAAAPAEAAAPPTEPTAPESAPAPGGGRTWIPLQHQARALRPSNFGRKKAR
jgi:hypothetical protein